MFECDECGKSLEMSQEDKVVVFMKSPYSTEKLENDKPAVICGECFWELRNAKAE